MRSSRRSRQELFQLDRYLDEQVFRYNRRKDDDGNKLTDADRFKTALLGIAGRRLTFAEVTGKSECGTWRTLSSAFVKF